ncbi:Multiple coagulation factor deficiency protein 2-like protein [Aphelenchoides besseyi]|nr:Multiple coagulation factor deficiency protein 2-like protein [Aphelenchoides besseyi]
MTRLFFTSFSLLFASIFIVEAHQQPSFPGQNANQPPEAHHQAHAQQAQQQQQPPPNQPNQAHFGGEAAKDEGHIKEHLEGKVDPTAHMTPEQLQYHYFTLHDLDKNGRLDGIELIKAITHFHQENPTNQHNDPHVPPPLPSEVELEQMIDSILNEDDYNKDGFIDYVEFLHAQRQREEQMKRQQQQTPPPR